MALELSRSELWCVLSRVQCSAVTGSDAANSPGVLCSKAGVCLARLISSTAQTTAALLLFLNLACLKPSQVPLLPCTVHPWPSSSLSAVEISSLNGLWGRPWDTYLTCCIVLAHEYRKHCWYGVIYRGKMSTAISLVLFFPQPSGTTELMCLVTQSGPSWMALNGTGDTVFDVDCFMLIFKATTRSWCPNLLFCSIKSW